MRTLNKAPLSHPLTPPFLSLLEDTWGRGFLHPWLSQEDFLEEELIHLQGLGEKM